MSPCSFLLAPSIIFCMRLATRLAVQQAIVAAKQDNPRRSIRQIRELLEAAGSVAAGSLSRSAIHRLLQQQGLSRIDGSASQLEEKRSFVAEFAGSIWYGDVMHGPAIPVAGRQRKVYLRSEGHTSELQSLMRISYAGFCLKKKKHEE